MSTQNEAAEPPKSPFNPNARPFAPSAILRRPVPILQQPPQRRAQHSPPRRSYQSVLLVSYHDPLSEQC